MATSVAGYSSMIKEKAVRPSERFDQMWEVMKSDFIFD